MGRLTARKKQKRMPVAATGSSSRNQAAAAFKSEESQVGVTLSAELAWLASTAG